MVIMGIVWVVEKPNTNRSSVAEKLMGNFAVRTVASLASLQRLLSLKRNMDPQVLIVNLDEPNYSVDWVESLLLYELPNCKRLYIRQCHMPLPVTYRDLQASAEADDFSLSRRVASLCSQRGGARNHMVQYKGVRLDVLNSTISFYDDDDNEPLPRKEALILKLLFENPGSCLSREGILDHVWSGAVVSPRTVNSHVSRLRKRLSRGGLTIESVYGGGYILI